MSSRLFLKCKATGQGHMINPIGGIPPEPQDERCEWCDKELKTAEERIAHYEIEQQ